MAKIIIEAKNNSDTRAYLVSVGVDQSIIDSMTALRFEFDEDDLVPSSDTLDPIINNILIPKVHGVEITANEGGDVDAPSEVVNGETIEITITPAEGFVVADVLINGVSVGSVTEYTIQNATEDYNVQVVFNTE